MPIAAHYGTLSKMHCTCDKEVIISRLSDDICPKVARYSSQRTGDPGFSPEITSGSKAFETPSQVDEIKANRGCEVSNAMGKLPPVGF